MKHILSILFVLLALSFYIEVYIEGEQVEPITVPKELGPSFYGEYNIVPTELYISPNLMNDWGLV